MVARAIRHARGKLELEVAGGALRREGAAFGVELAVDGHAHGAGATAVLARARVRLRHDLDGEMRRLRGLGGSQLDPERGGDGAPERLLPGFELSVEVVTRVAFTTGVQPRGRQRARAERRSGAGSAWNVAAQSRLPQPNTA